MFFLLNIDEDSAIILGNKTILKMEVCTDELNKLLSLYGGEPKVHAKVKIMEKLNVNLKQSANYLIQLFFKTGKKYSCTRTKIGKLLSIVAFEYALDGKQIFNETIYKYEEDCGTAIQEIMNYFDKDIYIQYIDFDNLQYIFDELDENLIQSEYADYNTLDISVRGVIEKVFRMFGSYSSSQLAKCINPIVNQIGVTNINGEIDIQSICNLKPENLKINEHDDISLIKYLFDKVRS